MDKVPRVKDARAIRYDEAGERESSGPIHVAVAYILKFVTMLEPEEPD